MQWVDFVLPLNIANKAGMLCKMLYSDLQVFFTYILLSTAQTQDI